MKIIKPKALRPGDVIGICAPASPAPSHDLIEKGIGYLERIGYRVKLGANLFKQRGYLAGTDEQRAADLHALFRDKQVNAIIALRGGFGSQRILPLLDYSLIRKNPKIFVGYSDITALQMALFARCGLVSFAGPMVAAGLARGLHGDAEDVFWRLLTSKAPIGKLPHRLKVWKRGSRSGILLGGNLSMMSTIFGTRFFPTIKNSILLLEDIGEQPYRIDRMLQQLRLGGALHSINGLLLGTFEDCLPETGKPSLTLRQIFDDLFQTSAIPILAELRHGHVSGSLTMPIGIRVHLGGTTRGHLELKESAVV